MIFVNISALPPRGLTRVLPHARHFTTLAEFPKATCSLPQSAHLSFKYLLFGCGIASFSPMLLLREIQFFHPEATHAVRLFAHFTSKEQANLLSWFPSAGRLRPRKASITLHDSSELPLASLQFAGLPLLDPQDIVRRVLFACRAVGSPLFWYLHVLTSIKEVNFIVKRVYISLFPIDAFF